MTKTKTTDREAESKRARTLIAAHVEREASDLSTDDRNDLIATAIEDWLNSKGSELECARRTVSAFFRKRNRQSKIREQRALDIAKASHGGRDNIEAERTRVYGKAEESELRAAVMKHCREAYQKSWGKLWDPKKAGRIRELCQPGDAIHVKAEAEANGYLQDLSNALRRSLAWTSGIPGADVYGPTIGGPAVAALWAATEAVRALQSQLPASKKTGFATDPMLNEELRRFVYRARWNPAISVALGSVRKPLGREADPSGAWGVKPSADEITVIWLLSGGWPKITAWGSGISVKTLINRKMRPTIAEAVKDVDGAAK